MLKIAVRPFLDVFFDFDSLFEDRLTDEAERDVLPAALALVLDLFDFDFFEAFLDDFLIVLRGIYSAPWFKRPV